MLSVDQLMCTSRLRQDCTCPFSQNVIWLPIKSSSYWRSNDQMLVAHVPAAASNADGHGS